MAKTEKGGFAEQKILETAKELFYEQGYKKTTVAEITRKAGVNNGLFTYYYGTKTNLSNLINAQYRVHFRNVLSMKIFEVYKEYDLALGIAVEYRKNLEMLEKNPKLRRFTIEQYAAVLVHEESSYEEILKQKENLYKSKRGHFYQLQKKLINPEISDIDLQVYQIAGYAATSSLIRAFHDRVLDCSVDYLGDKYIEICFQLLQLPNEQIEFLKKRSLEVASNIELKLRPYFIVE